MYKKRLTDPDLGISKTSHQTHIGLSEEMLSGWSDGDKEYGAYFFDGGFDRCIECRCIINAIRREDGSVNAPKIKSVGKRDVGGYPNLYKLIVECANNEKRYLTLGQLPDGKLLAFLGDDAGAEDVLRESSRKVVSFESKLEDSSAPISKPFLILAGPSGTGKSRWVRQEAYQTAQPTTEERAVNTKPSNYALISIKPNWHDSSELLGYVTRLGLAEDEKARYVVTDFVRFLAKAWSNVTVPHWLCLDEMNLAPVEQYFAEYLSVIETRRVVDENVITDPILPASAFLEMNDVDWARFCKDLGIDENSDLAKQFKKYGISIPQNLIVVGTVNMDETTHSFSRKVLDRAFVWEMPIGDLSKGGGRLGYPDTPRRWSPPEATEGSEVMASLELVMIGDRNAKDRVIDWLGDVNEALSGTPFQVSYRVRDELLLLVKVRGVSDEDMLNKTLDDGLYSKILPRIEGDEVRTRRALMGLMALLLKGSDVSKLAKWNELKDNFTEDHEIPFDALRLCESGAGFLCPESPDDPFAPVMPWRRSLNKIRSMLLKLEGQFTSYWD